MCSKCRYSVTEPSCAYCVIEEIKIWLYEKPINSEISKQINIELKNLLKKVELLDYVLIPSEDIWETKIMQCNSCKRDMHLMCSYCVINESSKIVKSNLKNKGFAKNFHESFNTELYDFVAMNFL